MLVSIVICNYNTADFLERCLRSVLSLQVSSPMEVIVVDNHSPDHSVAMLREKFPQIRLIANAENRWMTGGYNDGIKASRGDFICLLEPDTVIDPSAVQKMIDFMQEHPRYGMVSCKTFLGDGSMVRACSKDYPYALALLSYTFLGKIFSGKKQAILADFRYGDWDRMDTREVEVVYAHCILIRRAAYEAAGAFDETFRLYYSENDLCRRYREKGWRSGYVAQAEVVHHERQSVARSGVQRIAKIYQEDILSYYRKYHGPVPALFLGALIGVSNLIYSVKEMKAARVLSTFLTTPKNNRENVTKR
ncbi:MAG: hypothetical protein A3A86_01435 [Elusimicrobia bacterium RIFCSPLOWO2_01_FULL_60_11]|nr:MAG: hypothetical protein A3A86_01435 [Elusimicrobia bacterium RIFCSPLOWO2_01_FULL_60_11]